uniref:Uncharacterized protein LOC102806838 n=1 Tax=Saccoglossus kowalevskii TaxID=10224 RepID=A0ABM0MS42_SACKO|nr:PREDICTED: uncharacterized protein LOC102806838 [Saccoglossus kowalevskii]
MDILAIDIITKLCTDFYTDSEIEYVKVLLFDLCGDHSSKRLIRRQGHKKSMNNVQDILVLLQVIDQDYIPCFVVKDLSRLPPVDYNHVDLSLLLKDNTQFKQNIEALKEGLNSMSKLHGNIFDELRSIKEKLLVKADTTMLINACDNTELPVANSQINEVCSYSDVEVTNNESECAIITDVDGAVAKEATGVSNVNGFTTVRDKRCEKRRHQSYADAVEFRTNGCYESNLLPKPTPSENRESVKNPSHLRNRYAVKGFHWQTQDRSWYTNCTWRMSAFISRLGPDTTVDMQKSYIKNSMNITDICCVRLDTRYNTYSPFCVSTTETYFLSLMNPDSWPEEVHVRKFFNVVINIIQCPRLILPPIIVDQLNLLRLLLIDYVKVITFVSYKNTGYYMKIWLIYHQFIQISMLMVCWQ